MPKKRPSKVFRLNHWDNNPSAVVAILGDPDEVRISGSERSFISVKEDGITLAPGLPGKINIQGLSGSMRYAGMIQDLPFPMSMLPTTPVTPFPKQIVSPPLAELLPLIRDLSVISSMFVGV